MLTIVAPRAVSVPERILPEQKQRHDHQKHAEHAAKAVVWEVARDRAASEAADDAECGE